MSYVRYTFGVQRCIVFDGGPMCLVTKFWNSVDFYARKQLLLSSRLSHRNSVCLSHGWISQKRCKLKSTNLHRQLPGRL